MKRTQIEVDNENEKEEEEMNELTLSQQKVFLSDYMIRDDINDDNDMDPLLQITDVSMDDDPLLQFTSQKKMIVALIHYCSFLHKELKAVSINKT